MKKRFILDTNIILDDPAKVLIYKDKGEILLPYEILEELDVQKSRKDKVGYNARLALKIIYKMQGDNELRFVPSDINLLPLDFGDTFDNRILSAAILEKAIVVTNDLNVLIKASELKIFTETQNKTSSEDFIVEQPFMGFREIVVPDSFIDTCYTESGIHMKKTYEDLKPNEFLILVSEQDHKKKFICRFFGYEKPIKKVLLGDLRTVWNLNPKNIEQAMALDILMDPAVPVVSILGLAGSGKTLISLAAGLNQIFNRGSGKKHYRQMLVYRPIQVLGKDVGYLPGSLEEKLSPWAHPILDNLEYLSDYKKQKIDGWFESEAIKIEALAHIRGRSITNSFILIDEAQNLSSHELKTILTRIGTGTKIVLNGDIEQIDNMNMNCYSNGLSYVIERLKDYSLTAHITLQEGERSEVASMAAVAL